IGDVITSDEGRRLSLIHRRILRELWAFFPLTFRKYWNVLTVFIGGERSFSSVSWIAGVINRCLFLFVPQLVAQSRTQSL
ncbi:hypothetical protein A2U01_0062092, partial [Trifolium medium]|nr:hypothetical protein [Trifolium medium]